MRELRPIRPPPPIRRDMNITANRLPSTSALAGRTIALEYEDGTALNLAFEAAKVRWTATASSATARAGKEAYDAVEVRPGVFFVDYVLADGCAAFSHVIDIEHGRSLSIASELIDAAGQCDLRERLSPAKLKGNHDRYEPIAETRELLGKRLFCEYSAEAALEHIYANSGTIVWQWLRSPPELALEVGIEAVSMWKIAPRLYLISTRGEDPIQLTLLLDLEQMRNVGRLFGRSAFGLVDRRCGAKITFLGEFAYPDGYSPG